MKEVKKQTTEYEQTIEEKLEVLRCKINSIVKWINAREYRSSDNTRQIKKDSCVARCNNYLDTRSEPEEDNKNERKTGDADNQSADNIYKERFVEDDVLARMQYKDGMFKRKEGENKNENIK